ncbi:AI-2E family transporter [Leifsonia poae]|uniref:AI-2E family transporter n=1 Tax=Leifsonia poae TaxID=110933 RepID=UPI003D6719A1
MAERRSWWPFHKQHEAPAPPPAEEASAQTDSGRGVRILLGLASAVVIAFGMHAIGGILAPVLLALILTICAQPVRVWLTRHGTPDGLATVAVALTVFALLAGFVGLLILATAEFVGMLPQYTEQLEQLGQQLGSWLESIGIGAAQVQTIVSGFDPGKLLNLATSVLGDAFGLVSFLVIVLTMLILMPADAAYTPTVMKQLQPTKPGLVFALSGYARNVRRYMVVTAALGIVQGLINGFALVILGVPAALLWAILSFLCSFIPNVGYFVALIPPLVFGYLTGGWGTVIAVIVVYGLINAVVQSIVQPKVVGNAVALSQTLTFFSVLFWAVVIGPIGAILAVPLTLFVRAILIDADPGARIWRAPIGDLTEAKRLMKQESQARKAQRHRGPAGGPAASGSGS